MDAEDGPEVGMWVRPFNIDETTIIGQDVRDPGGCALCKRFTARFEHATYLGPVRICTRCEHHVSDHGLDGAFFWALEHVTADDMLNLRFQDLHRLARE